MADSEYPHRPLSDDELLQIIEYHKSATGDMSFHHAHIIAATTDLIADTAVVAIAVKYDDDHEWYGVINVELPATGDIAGNRDALRCLTDLVPAGWMKFAIKGGTSPLSLASLGLSNDATLQLVQSEPGWRIDTHGLIESLPGWLLGKAVFVEINGYGEILELQVLEDDK
jgi:hypothetical protein